MTAQVRRVVTDHRSMRNVFYAVAIVAALLAIVVGSVRADHFVSSPRGACAEDSWCWQPLTQGNHRGTINLDSLNRRDHR